MQGEIVLLNRNAGMIPNQIYQQLLRTNQRGETVINQLRSQTLGQLPKVRKWQIKKLFITRNNIDEGILPAIKQIHFDKLKFLSVSHGIIESIQGISRLKAHLLQKIDLSSNKISNLTSLRKIESRNLFQLAFSSNSIVEDPKIHEISHKKLKRIYFEWDPKHQTQCLKTDFMIKIKAKNFEEYEFWFESKQRILDKKYLQSISRKYQNKASLLTKIGYIQSP